MGASVDPAADGTQQGRMWGGFMAALLHKTGGVLAHKEPCKEMSVKIKDG